MGWKTPADDFQATNEERSKFYGSKGLGELLMKKIRNVPTAKEEEARIKKEERKSQQIETARIKRQELLQARARSKKSAGNKGKGKAVAQEAQAAEVIDDNAMDIDALE